MYTGRRPALGIGRFYVAVAGMDALRALLRLSLAASAAARCCARSAHSAHAASASSLDMPAAAAATLCAINGERPVESNAVILLARIRALTNWGVLSIRTASSAGHQPPPFARYLNIVRASSVVSSTAYRLERVNKMAKSAIFYI
jgi:hypothetical protein